MMRDQAIELLVRDELAQLKADQREAMLLDWWAIGPKDPNYLNLPEQLRDELRRSEQPLDPASKSYDPLLFIALASSFTGVLNLYLERRLAVLGRHEKVEGSVERLLECPCCNYCSLRERGGYEICRVCFWEDDGTFDAQSVSGPNHMTLQEARRNFDEIGAMSSAAREQVLSDGRDRYVGQGRRVVSS